MIIFINSLKLLLNIALFLVYSLISVIIVNFFYGLWVVKILDQQVPSADDIVHMKIAIFVLVLVLVITLLLRKYFYFGISFKVKKTISNQKKKHSKKTIEKIENTKIADKKIKTKHTDEEIKIYIDKEIK